MIAISLKDDARRTMRRLVKGTTEHETDSHALAAGILRAMALDSVDGLERALSRLEGASRREPAGTSSAQAQEEMELLQAIALDMRRSTILVRRRRRAGLDGSEVYEMLLGHLAETE